MRLDDNGVGFDTVLTAGLVSMQVCASGDKTLSADGKRDTAKPVVAWWISRRRSPQVLTVLSERPRGLHAQF